MKKLCIAIWLWTCALCLAEDSVVLQTGDVNAEKLWVGAFADVTYRGEKDKRETANGKIRGIGRNTFIIGKGFWNEHIAFEKVDLLILGSRSQLVERLKKRVGDPLRVYRRESNTSIVVGQLFMGSAFGVGGGFVGALVGAGVGPKSDGGELYIPVGVFLGAATGLALGSALGATIASKEKLNKSPWKRALVGSLLGMGLGITATSMSHSLWPTLFVAPPVLATSFSWLGNSRQYNQVTVNAGLLRNGGQGVLAAYHF